MDKIKAGIFEEIKLIGEGISALLHDIEDIEVVLCINDRSKLFEFLKTRIVHVLIIHAQSFDQAFFNFMLQLNGKFPKTKIIILANNTNSEIINKCIKSNVKGLLSKDSSQSDLIEAIYSLRAGFDYFSKSITQLLINNYVEKIKEEDESAKNQNALSQREVEILKLWGDNYSNIEIAEKYCISVRTVESHKNHIMQKLNLKTTVDLVKYAIKNNIIEGF
jgi:DNA-binding NarL/FixJ family response regulator